MENNIIKRVVVKVGTSTITHKTGKLHIRKVEKLVKTLSDLQNAGFEILLVSSGAIGLGMSKLGLKEKPTDTPMKQACAAVGQCELMKIYDDFFGKYSVTVAQILLTKFVLIEDRRKNVINAVESIISQGVIPIVNENDTVAIDELELEMGENDTLSAIMAVVSHADLLIIMSDIDGLYECDPHINPNAKHIDVVTEIDEHIKSIAGGAGSSLGKGGMATKINAAKISTDAGIDMIIMDGSEPEKLYDLLLENKKIGTLFSSKK